jgi:hypothetical protein
MAKGKNVPFAAGRSVKYPARKRTVVFGNNRPARDTQGYPSDRISALNKEQHETKHLDCIGVDGINEWSCFCES